MEFSEIVARRYSCRRYDPTCGIGDEELAQILGDAVLSPSSYNLQHWRFVVVRDAVLKSALCAAAWNQAQVESCSAVVAICADLQAHRDVADVLRDAPAERRDLMVPLIQAFYEGKPELMRDEALRSGSLAAMTLMLSAASRGWDSCPMIGFDADEVARLLEVPEGWIVTMLVTLGKGIGSVPTKIRRPLSEVVSLETATGVPFHGKNSVPLR
jgi:nitroreductase